MKAPAKINLNEISSARSTTPPHAAMTGTDSCTIAARVAVRPRKAAYQITYPTPEATAPESTASRIPDWDSCTVLNVTSRTAMISGTARIKLPAVSARGDPVPRPRNEYTPQAIPAIIINAEPISEGALSPGITKYTNPPNASKTPSHSRGCGRSPERSATRIMVTCTVPKRINAPVPAVRLRYANEKVIAYMNSMVAEIQLPRTLGPTVFLCRSEMNQRVSAPAVNLTVV